MGEVDNSLGYKGYKAEVDFDEEDKLFLGKVAGISDLILFEGVDTDELMKSFHEAVDDYLEYCKETNKEPGKTDKEMLNEGQEIVENEENSDLKEKLELANKMLRDNSIPENLFIERKAE